MENSQSWYIVKQKGDGSCSIVAGVGENTSKEQEKWGPFSSQGEAIARRVGLIRAGKCKPV